MRDFDTLPLRHLQATQPWAVPYSANFMAATRYTGPDGHRLMPHLFGAHAVLHASKTVGQLAAVFEAVDHTGGHPTDSQLATLRDKSADLVTAAMRLANLYDFDLAEAVVERSEEKNNVTLPDWAPKVVSPAPEAAVQDVDFHGSL